MNTVGSLVGRPRPPCLLTKTVGSLVGLNNCPRVVGSNVGESLAYLIAAVPESSVGSEVGTVSIYCPAIYLTVGSEVGEKIASTSANRDALGAKKGAGTGE